MIVAFAQVYRPTQNRYGKPSPSPIRPMPLLWTMDGQPPDSTLARWKARPITRPSRVSATRIEPYKPHVQRAEDRTDRRDSDADAAGTAIQPSRANGARGTVRIDPRFEAGLKDLAGFERIWLIYWFHQTLSSSLLVTPFLDQRERGVFATRAPSLNPGVESAPPRYLNSNRREAENAENPRNVADTGEVANYRCCQQNKGFWVRTGKGWLPDMDSNHDSRLQRPLSYH